VPIKARDRVDRACRAPMQGVVTSTQGVYKEVESDRDRDRTSYVTVEVESDCIA